MHVDVLIATNTLAWAANGRNKVLCFPLPPCALGDALK